MKHMHVHLPKINILLQFGDEILALSCSSDSIQNPYNFVFVLNVFFSEPQSIENFIIRRKQIASSSKSIYVPFCQKHRIKSYYLIMLFAVSFYMYLSTSFERSSNRL